MRSDFPRTTQQSFIIYSKLERDGNDDLIIPSAPVVWQSAAFTSETGFATAAGSYESDAVDITPVLTDGVLSFEVSGKQQGVYHSGSFELTLTTVGDAENDIEPTEATFTIPVAVFGKADLLGHNRTRTYYVGDRVEPFSIVPSAINPVIDYGGTSGNLKDVTQQYDSGLYISHIQSPDPMDSRTVDIRLGGTASRPGVYLAWVYANQWTEGGQYDDLPGSFDRGNNAVPMIITILDHDHAEGNLMVSAKATVGQASHYRVVMLTEAVQAFASAEYLYNCEMTQSDPTLWSGSHTEGSGEGSITYQYQLRLDGGSWKLEGRSFGWGETPPAFDLYDSSAKRLPEQDVPHVNGWTVGIQGLTEFALRAREFPNDPWVLFGFFNHLAPSVWEQQPMYCPQFEGLVTAPAVQFDGGYIYSEDAEITNDFEGFLVKKEFIARVVTPYAPPASEKYTYTTIPEEGDPETITRPVRDVAARIGNVPHSLNGDRPGNVGVPGGDPWGYWAGARRISPKNGTSSDLVLDSSVSCSYSLETSSDSQHKYEISPDPSSNGYESHNTSSLTWSGEVPITSQYRGSGVINLMVGVSNSDGNMSYESESKSSTWSIDSIGESKDETTITITPNEDGETISKSALYMASGPFTGLCKHEAISTGWAGFDTSGTAERHTVTVLYRPGQPNQVTQDITETESLNRSAYYLPNSLSLISGDKIELGGYKKTTKQMSAHSAKSYTHVLLDDPYMETGSADCTASHSSVQEIINGVTIASGATYSKFTINGVVTEETVSDPDGSTYESLLDSFIDIPVPPPSGTMIYSEVINDYGKSSSVEVIEFTGSN